MVEEDFPAVLLDGWEICVHSRVGLWPGCRDEAFRFLPFFFICLVADPEGDAGPAGGGGRAGDVFPCFPPFGCF